jgi:hypothetical protein
MRNVFDASVNEKSTIEYPDFLISILKSATPRAIFYLEHYALTNAKKSLSTDPEFFAYIVSVRVSELSDYQKSKNYTVAIGRSLALRDRAKARNI